MESSMKKFLLAAMASLTAGSAMAGGLAEPAMEPEVVEAKAASSAGVIIPLLLLILVAAALSGGGSDGRRVVLPE